MSITGHDDFGLTAAKLARLGSRKVVAYVYLKTYDVTQDVRRRPPEQRHAHLAARADRWVRQLKQRFPGLVFRSTDRVGATSAKRPWFQLPHTFKVSAPARTLRAIAEMPGVYNVCVVAVSGMRKQREPRKPLDWYCVRGLVAIVVEGQVRGMQTTEDRFLLVRAESFEDAERRLKKVWREYATPYLNSYGHMVSWSLDRVVDVYDLRETDLDPSGVEVFSRLGKRRLRPDSTKSRGRTRRITSA